MTGGDARSPSLRTSGRAMRLRAQELVREKSAQYSEDTVESSPESARKILNELRVHQIELEMQNEELRRAQVELDVVRKRYFDLYDLAPVSYCALSEQGIIVQANLTAATLLGMVRGALVKQSISNFIFKENQDTYYLHRKQLIEDGKPQSYELQMVKMDGTQFWAHLEVTAAEDGAGAPEHRREHRIVLSDITERKRNEEELARSECKQATLAAELQHRVKNILATVQSLVSQMPKGATVKEFVADLGGRLRAISLTQDLFLSTPHGITLRELVWAELSPFQLSNDNSFEVDGPDAILTVKSAQALGMAFHELVTNALKYGALSRPGGKVTVTWTLEKVEGGQRLILKWVEAGGPAVTAPTRRGFGLTLLERGIAYDLGGQATLEFAPLGIRWRVNIFCENVICHCGGNNI